MQKHVSAHGKILNLQFQNCYLVTSMQQIKNNTLSLREALNMFNWIPYHKERASYH